ncbi:uncharacterized protein LOC125236607 [Leguminivora glycinivorella]|uniref:uncharacterized protein LOC125236607 n=1 Tax=Leguminivora glycinivorella TaxID=1035111 RepID=UPI00200FD867|nr:uncharacterized protein LOC125236607 [Leguminivora glycinivorella]
MFFKLFLLVTFLTKVSPSKVVAEQDYYKYDEYDDYQYDDPSLHKVETKSTNKPTLKAETTPYKYTKGEPTESATIKWLKNLVNEDFETNDSLSKSNEAADNEEEITYILTDRPSVEEDKPSYEVTEIVDDIPNTVTFKPIVTNFTIKVPLNNATTVTSNANSIKDTNENKINKGNVPRKTSINIFHVNAEIEDDKDKKPVIQNINIHKIPFGIFKVKDDTPKIKEDVFNHIYSTELYDEPHKGHYFPNIFAAPGNFLRRLRDKGAALYHKFF